MLTYFFKVWIRRIDGKVRCLFDFQRDFIFDLIEHLTIRHLALLQPFSEQQHRIAFALPLFFFGLGAVIGTIDVAHMMAVKAVGSALQKSRTFTASGSFDECKTS